MVNDWSKISFPVIENMSRKWAMKDFMSVQPLTTKDGPPSYMEQIDISNPRVGVVIHDKDKHPEPNRPPLCGCCREMWSKIWTPRRGWVYEEKDPKAFKRAVKKYAAKYKAQIERERKAWNKKHGIKNPFCMNMIVLLDSAKNSSK